LSPRTVTIETTNLEKHLKPVLGDMLVSDIGADQIGAYQSARLKQGAAPKTINLELGTLRAILRKHRLWANIQPDVRMLDSRQSVGCALSPEQEAALLRECRLSRSRSLYVAVVMALGTCMRYGEIREMRWNQIDFGKSELRVGNSKTKQEGGRVILLSPRVRMVLEFWAARFPSPRTLYSRLRNAAVKERRTHLGLPAALFMLPIRRNLLATGKKHRKLQRNERGVLKILKPKSRNPCAVAFTICGTPAAHVCWKPAYPFPWCPTSWVGPHQPP